MKKDWIYKKLGEVAEIYQPKTLATSELIADGKYLVYGANGVIGRYNEYNHKEKEILVTCRGATCGTINISEPYSWINGNAMVVHIIDDTLSFDFLKYSLNHLDWTNIITGAAQPQITRQNLSPAIIPIPPLSIQRSIVSELDLLHSVIEKKQEQLRALDNLAQSLFYQMFGDPITNPMGWEIKKLGEVFEIGSSKRVYQSEWTTSGVPFYRAREIVKLARDGYVDNELFITEKLYDKYAEKYGTPKVGDILVTAVGTLGVTYIVNEKDRFYYKDGNIICLHHKGAAVDSKYVDFCFKTPFVREQIDNWSGATVGTFTIVKANTTLIPLPPLSLQQSFAAKVSAIEAQKQAITQSIKDVESLLAQRMDHYFG